MYAEKRCEALGTRRYLELQALVQHHAALHPGLLQAGPLAVQGLQLLLDLRAGVVAPGQQLLAELLESLEGPGTGIDLSAVFLQREHEKIREWRMPFLLINIFFKCDYLF